jgi:hypothetical protein
MRAYRPAKTAFWHYERPTSPSPITSKTADAHFNHFSLNIHTNPHLQAWFYLRNYSQRISP